MGVFDFLRKRTQDNFDYTGTKAEALELFKAKNFPEALPLFDKLAQKNVNSDDWFNLASCAILCRDIDKGHDALGKAISLYDKTGSENNLPVGMMCYYFMQALRDVGEFSLAFVQLMKFKDVYIDLKTTDDMFLHMRGLPFLSHLLDSSVSILKNQTIADSKQWLSDFSQNVDDEGKEFIQSFIKRNGF